jgi:methionyl-tRNA formyltransferase
VEQDYKFKIGYFADGPWSHKTFQLLIDDNRISIEFIVPRLDTKDFTLLSYANKYNIDYLEYVHVNSESFFNKAKSYNCDLFISMSFNQIFKKKIIELPKLKTINCHAGNLPFYRGRNVLNWVLINDEPEFGITVHFIDEGIDTGDIILQRKFPISEQDDYNSLLEVAYEECAKILYDSVKLIITNTFKVISQNEIDPNGSYCRMRKMGDEIIDWNQSSRKIFNFCRALSKPGPVATTFLNNKEIKISKVREVQKTNNIRNCESGMVIEKIKDNFIVKTLDSCVELIEYDTELKLKVGDKLE